MRKKKPAIALSGRAHLTALAGTVPTKPKTIVYMHGQHETEADIAKRVRKESSKKATEASLTSPNRKQARTDWQPHTIDLANDQCAKDESISTRRLVVEVLNGWREDIDPPNDEDLREFISACRKDGRIPAKKTAKKSR